MAKTVKVRIAVAVDPDGKWAATGWEGLKTDEAFDFILDDLKHGESRFWLTAELPVPDVAEIQAEIENA